jgi:hypothetical protein
MPQRKATSRAWKKSDERLQKRLGALNRTCTDQMEKIDKAFTKGTTEKVGVLKPLQLKK